MMRVIARQRAKLDAFFRKRFRPDSLATWYFRALRSQHRRRFGPCGNYYEFGVGRGRTMMRYLKALKLHCEIESDDLYRHRIFAFDSFEGLPAKASPRDDHPGWDRGKLSHPLEHVQSRIGGEIDLKRGTVRFVKGFFSDSLTPELARELEANPPSIVTIDVDYYSSAKTVLDWLLPFTPSGCLFYFDDIWAFFGHPEMGELAAISEINRGGIGWMLPYTELGATAGGRSYIFVRREFEYKRLGRTAPPEKS